MPSAPPCWELDHDDPLLARPVPLRNVWLCPSDEVAAAVPIDRRGGRLSVALSLRLVEDLDLGDQRKQSSVDHAPET